MGSRYDAGLKASIITALELVHLYYGSWRVRKMDYYKKIRMCIEQLLEQGCNEFVLYPFGERGLLTKQILNECYGIQEKLIVDNRLSLYNRNIKNLEFLQQIAWGGKARLLITSDNMEIYQEIRTAASRYVKEEYIVDMFRDVKTGVKKAEPIVYTIRGKYSYGPLCNHELVEKVGAFCSFAPGTDVVRNHPIDLISTHAFLYWGGENDIYDKGKYKSYRRDEDTRKYDWFFQNVEPIGNVHKGRKVVIGNDVWLGKNVIITNGAKIGNGVIAGAGAVITKDVPDYAIVAGVPARIIRYRYSQEQIDKLNAIAWWDWPDEQIRERYNDFFEDVQEFINKYL